MTAQQYMEVHADAHAGFTTENQDFSVNMITVNGQAPQKMSTVTNYFTVDSNAYANAVYPVNIDAPTKEITYDVHVEVWNYTVVPTTEHFSTLS